MNVKDVKVDRIVTSIKINPELWKEAKKKAIDQDVDLSVLVERALKAWISESKK